MDQAFENIINIGFYFILFFIVVAALGVDPFILFASVSGFVFSFTFMFGSATSTFFQGVMFILARRPYDLGGQLPGTCVRILFP